jgi:hypothetical protein
MEIRNYAKLCILTGIIFAGVVYGSETDIPYIPIFRENSTLSAEQLNSIRKSIYILYKTDKLVKNFAKSDLPVCNDGEVLKSDGSNFICIIDNDTNSNLSDNDISNMGYIKTDNNCTADQIIRFDGTSWNCSEANTNYQTLNLADSTIEISEGNAIDLSFLKDGTGTDNQELSFEDNVLGISGGSNTIDLTNLQIDRNFNSILPVFGEPSLKISEFVDIFYKADKRFTVTNGNRVLFDGNNDSAFKIPTNTTTTININVADQAGIPTSSLTYAQGHIYISFYHTNNEYEDISIKVKNKDDAWYNATFIDDIADSSNPNIKVLKYEIPHLNYITDYEMSITTNDNNCWITSIVYISDRHTSQTELPYVSKYLNTNNLPGNFNVNGNLGVGTNSPKEKLEVNGNVKANYFIGDGSQLTGISSGSKFVNGTNTTDAVFNDGNVGIGTNNPETTLNIAKDDTHTIVHVENTSATNSRYPGLMISSYDSYYGHPNITGRLSVGSKDSPVNLNPNRTVFNMVGRAYIDNEFKVLTLNYYFLP